MTGERTYPCLPCADVDASTAFYETLGFERTYRQVRPNPYAVVARGDIHIHLFGIDGFDPADSSGGSLAAVSAIVLSETDAAEIADELAHVTEQVLG